MTSLTLGREKNLFQVGCFLKDLPQLIRSVSSRVAFCLQIFNSPFAAGGKIKNFVLATLLSIS